MNHKKRINKLIRGKKIDPPAVALWKHFPVDDLEPESFSEITTNFQRKYEWAFIKISYHGLYSVENWGVEIDWADNRMEVPVVEKFGIQKPAQWADLQPLSIKEGAFKRELDSTKKIIEKSNKNDLKIPTIFSPSTTARKMSGKNFLKHVKSNPAEVHEGLKIITDNTIKFVKALLKLDIDGIFFASQLATRNLMDIEQYEEFGVKYDLQVLEEVKNKLNFNIFHVHGEEPMLEIAKEYPVEALNWHDRRTKMSLKDARKITDKILIGGIEENDILKNSDKDSLKEHVKDALEQVPDGKLILGPGCVGPLDCPEEQFEMLKDIIYQV